MSATKNIRRTQERNFSPHLMLMSAARRSCEAAARKQPGYFYDALSAMTLSALALEAMGNTIGAAMLPRAEYLDFERLGPTDKLSSLAVRLAVPYDRQVEPWASALWLVSFRNAVAHAKPELVKEDLLMTEKEHENRRQDTPESKLEKEITPGNAKRALRVAEAILELLVGGMDPAKTFGLLINEWSGGSKWLGER